jgi:hypothetical protein
LNSEQQRELFNKSCWDCSTWKMFLFWDLFYLKKGVDFENRRKLLAHITNEYFFSPDFWLPQAMSGARHNQFRAKRAAEYIRARAKGNSLMMRRVGLNSVDQSVTQCIAICWKSESSGEGRHARLESAPRAQITNVHNKKSLRARRDEKRRIAAAAVIPAIRMQPQDASSLSTHRRKCVRSLGFFFTNKKRCTLSGP